MANQFNGGYFRITSPAFSDGDQLVGVLYLGPPSLQVIVGRADAVNLNMWQLNPLGDGTYMLGVCGSDHQGYTYTGAINEHYVVGTVRSDESLKWRFFPQPQIASDAFTIELDGQLGVGWIMGGYSGKDVVLGELPPPGSQLQPTQYFRIQPF